MSNAARRDAPPGSDAANHAAGTLAVDAFFATGGPLARALKDYEPRASQRDMARAAADIIQAGGTLLAEAGTGTGKTLAYLVPAILSGHRVLISTGTKNLQEQIFFKDLPALQQVIDTPFSATLMKGRSNYLCLHRWELYKGRTAEDAGHLIDTSDRILLPVLSEWAATTQTGDRAELTEVPEDLPLWRELSADAETCLGSSCPRYGDCFVTLMRQRAAESDVVIVNHHLLCADAAVRHGDFGEIIPSSPTLVVDEAHQLEDVATQYFGIAFSPFRVDDLLRDTERALQEGAFDAAQRSDIARAMARVADRSRIFFSGWVLQGARLMGETRSRYTAETIVDHLEDGTMLAGALEGLEATLALAAQRSAPSDTRAGAGEALATVIRRAGELRTALRFLLKASDDDFVYYLDVRGSSVFLRASPIDVSRLVREALLDRFRSVIITSATLTVDNAFDYVKRRLGVRDASALRVASEFDYTTQALLYLPRRMPPPKVPAFAEAAARETVALLQRSRGRAFVLFTSYAMLRAVQQVVEMSVEYPIFVQGTAPRSVLIEQFKQTPHAVLLATSSFWQGVDVIGDALSCVIIDKLPFASPRDPVVAARIDAITSRGGDAFSEYQVPLAIVTLQQGLGRLIRHRNDRGVLAVLDPRLRTMGYGRRFLASLPPAPITHDLQAVERFFM